MQTVDLKPDWLGPQSAVVMRIGAGCLLFRCMRNADVGHKVLEPNSNQRATKIVKHHQNVIATRGDFGLL